MSLDGKIHPLKAWKVLIQNTPSNYVRKEVYAMCLGKVMLISDKKVKGKQYFDETIHPEFTKSKTYQKTADFSVDNRLFNPYKSPTKQSSQILLQNQLKKVNTELSFQESHEIENEEEQEEIVLWNGSKFNNNNEEIFTPSDSTLHYSENLSSNISSISNTQSNITLNNIDIINNTSTVTTTSTMPLPLNQIGGIISVNKEELLKRLMESPKLSKKGKHLIVIDGPNVARVFLIIKISYIDKYFRNMVKILNFHLKELKLHWIIGMKGVMMLLLLCHNNM